ncbi:MAG TPA: hypothetical protein VGA22_13820 [Gemmatimonadales bacterium]|jgi:hypothetical protein
MTITSQLSTALADYSTAQAVARRMATRPEGRRLLALQGTLPRSGAEPTLQRRDLRYRLIVNRQSAKANRHSDS